MYYTRVRVCVNSHPCMLLVPEPCGGCLIDVVLGVLAAVHRCECPDGGVCLWCCRWRRWEVGWRFYLPVHFVWRPLPAMIKFAYERNIHRRNVGINCFPLLCTITSLTPEHTTQRGLSCAALRPTLLSQYFHRRPFVVVIPGLFRGHRYYWGRCTRQADRHLT